MKKIMLGMLVFATSNAMALGHNFNLYGKMGVDLVSRFDRIAITRNETQAPKKTAHFSPSFFAEITYNATPKTELGFGLGYVYRKHYDYKVAQKTNSGNNALIDVIEEYPVNRYFSIPLYFLVKHNFQIQQNLHSYIKVDFGHAFNKIKSNMTLIEHNDYIGNGKYHTTQHNISLNVENGNYYGVGFGIEYKNMLAELAYTHTDSHLTYSSKLIRGEAKYNNDSLRFSVGYRF
ncbi:outer membrane beta-barrel protein [Pasteurella oralis]|uniref:outer membrane beta-barrel protein n=1 Tax=Pasteurella oralis TaxID=1071947 RepID=UPI000C7A671E|nr:outer membrane beta-barrel protein [Pasteurella oralis]